MDVDNENGNFQQRLVTGSISPPPGGHFGPGRFGKFGGDLLVGNFSYVDSEINAYDPTLGAWKE